MTASAWALAGTAGTSPLTTKGDLYGFSTVDARVPIGTNGYVLTADSTVGLGLKWAAPGGLADADYGDITVSASGATWTIDAGVVTLAKMANMATDSFLGRDTAGTGPPEALSVSTVRTLLSISNVENAALSTWAGSTAIVTLGTITTGTVPVARVSGLATVATSGSASDLGTGTLPIARIADGAVTLAKQADVATARILGRTTAGTGVPEALTAAQAKTVLAIANTDVSGLGTLSTVNDAPSDGSTYGRLNGAWAVAGGGSGLTQPQVMARSSFGGF